MQHRDWLAFATAMLMFPQIAETLYSPALVSLAEGFAVTASDASLTLSLYFVAFAVGVLFWGRACDIKGRRPTLLGGLALYALAALAALLASDFSQLLAARMVAAFAAAVGSVVTQTALRDCYNGAELARVFSLIGACLAISPALGMLGGGWLDQAFGYRGVLAAQLILASALLAWGWHAMPETQAAAPALTPLRQVLTRLLADARVLLASALVALFNIAVFAWYSLAPFVFEGLGQAQWMGYSGVALALGSLAGARLNALLLGRAVAAATLMKGAALLLVLGALGVTAIGESPWIVAPMALIMVAFAMAIPLLLGSALLAYADCRGTAAALFGLLYYLQIGAGLMVVGLLQMLAPGLLLIALAICALSLGYLRYLRG